MDMQYTLIRNIAQQFQKNELQRFTYIVDSGHLYFRRLVQDPTLQTKKVISL